MIDRLSVMMMMVVFLVFMHFESFLWVSLIMEYHHFTVRILIRVPTLNVALFIRYFVSLLWILVIS